MKVESTALPEVKLLTPKVHGDNRGFFLESWNAKTFAEAGIDVPFVQDNHSRSPAGILRGMHYQLHEPQGKLVRVVRGAVFDVAVDCRRSSPNFGKWVGYELSGDNHLMLWVPPGFAHGFLVLEDGTDFVYKCSTLWHQPSDVALRWDDPAVGIEWPLDRIGGRTPTLAPRDAAAPALAELETFA